MSEKAQSRDTKLLSRAQLPLEGGPVDTPILPSPGTLTFPRAPLNFGADFSIKESKANEVVLTNIRADIDRPETIRLSWSTLTDVYRNSSIDPSVYAPSRKGVNVLAQVTNVLSISPSANSEARVDIPVSTHLVIKTGAQAEITADVIITQVSRLLSSLFETGKTDTSRLEAILRGALVPKDVR